MYYTASGIIKPVGGRPVRSLREESLNLCTGTCASVDEDMLRSVWTELDYRIDICRVTKGSHIEHL